MPYSLGRASGCVYGERLAEKAYTVSISQAGSGEATSNFESGHGAVATRFTDRGQAHHNIISSTAAAAQQQGRGWRLPRQMSCGTAARPGSITTIFTTTATEQAFFLIFV